MSVFNKIPDEIIRYILNTHIPMISHYIIRHVCKRFRIICKSTCDLLKITIIDAVSHGYVNILKYIYNENPRMFTSTWLQKRMPAVYAHDTWTQYNLFYVVSIKMTWIQSAYSNCIMNGNIASLIWMREHSNIPFDSYTLSAALNKSYLDVADYVITHDRQNVLGDPETICYFAIRSENLSTLFWIIDAGIDINDYPCLDFALYINNIHIADYILRNFPEDNILTTHLLVSAIAGSANTSIEWLMNKNCPADLLVLKLSASTGNKKLCEYTLAQNIVWDIEVSRHAIRSGNTDFLEWAYNHNYIDTNDSELYVNIYHNVFNILCWLEEHDCPLNLNNKKIYDICYDPSVILWLHTHGLPLTPKLYNIAIEDDDIDCFKYLYGLNCAFNPQSYETAINNNARKCLRFMCNAKLPYPKSIIQQSIELDLIDLTEIMVNSGIPLPINAYHIAARSSLDMIKYLDSVISMTPETAYEILTTNIVHNPAIIEWLNNRRTYMFSDKKFEFFSCNCLKYELL